MTEVLEYLNTKPGTNYGHNLLNVRDNGYTPDLLLPIIEYLDETNEFILASLLTNAYFSL